MNLYSILLHAHSGLRWLVLVFLLLAIFQTLARYRRNVPYPGRDRMVLLGLIFTHLQLVLGLILYFISPKVQFEGNVMGDDVIRFFTVEHIAGMLVAVALITIGYARAKRQAGEVSGYRSVWVFYGLGLLIMLLTIPWPWREQLGSGWM